MASRRDDCACETHFPFIFESDCLYRGIVTVKPTPLYPAGMTGFLKLCTSGDDIRHQQWRIHAELNDGGRDTIENSHVFNVYKDLWHVQNLNKDEWLSHVDTQGSSSRLRLVFRDATTAVYEGMGKLWYYPGEVNIRTILQKQADGSSVSMRRHVLIKDKWEPIVDVLYRRIANRVVC